MSPESAQFEHASPRGEIRYVDDADHFERGLLRLLALDRTAFERWVAFAEEAPGVLLARLRAGFASLRPIEAPAPPAGVVAGPYGIEGHVLQPSIAENPAFGVAADDRRAFGWLVDRAGRCVADPPPYEEAYFEGPTREAGGYGSYMAQAGWRLEKAARQVREIAAATGLRGGRALDVGSGYGFFRKALGEAGFEHHGVEVSAHARKVARELFGFETLGEPLEAVARRERGRFHLVTLWDVVEHFPDPAQLLADCRDVLAPGGIVALKTPNLDCPEAEVFGPHYHSLKREHLVYLTPRSVRDSAARAGLDVIGVESVSHLLAGFVGREQTKAWEREGRGADLVAYLRARDAHDVRDA